MLLFLLQLICTAGLPLLAFFGLQYIATASTRDTAPVKADAAQTTPLTKETSESHAFAKEVEHELCAIQKQQWQQSTTALTEQIDDTCNSTTCQCCCANDADDSCGGVGGTAGPASTEADAASPSAPKILIAYATHSQNALTFAHKLFSLLSARLHTSSASFAPGVVAPEVKILELQEDDDDAAGELSPTTTAEKRTRRSHTCRVETLLEDQSYAVVLFVVSTYTDGRAPPRSQSFEMLLKDAYEDHRVPRSILASKRCAVFGLGDIAYGELRFNQFAKHLHEWCRGLGAPAFVVPPVYATDANAPSLFQVFSTALLKWMSRAEFHVDGRLTVARKARRRGGDGAADMDDDATSAIASTAAASTYADTEDEESDNGGDNDDAAEDVEDLVWDGDDANSNSGGGDGKEPPELLYPKLRQNLEKQGYRIVGSHSGVKLCRWTKSMLRGRGGCYKHTFYNINSSQCMEMTPSLACANKCVFCWRHHTNPVSRTFRWKQDPPELLIAQGMAGHYQMIKQMRGVPGVTPERLATAMQIRHCALSLVGEPIMYPQINGFCKLLHDHHISSFMVTNAQFPDQLRDLDPVVQLYLSIDAPTPEELKRIDRPLFEDYWERCLACVQELHKKRQRTVFRLTLVNAYNTENTSAYADLVEMGWPDFIEVKGVTYCGTSNSSTLTMKDNVPRHDEVIQFCKALCQEMRRRHPGYQTKSMNDAASGADAGAVVIAEAERNQPYHIACEHEHSCCVLLALDKFYFDGCWHTWIDYAKFYSLVESGSTTFTSLDYAAATPSWATYNSVERGFDPEQTRVLRKNARPTVITSGC